MPNFTPSERTAISRSVSIPQSRSPSQTGMSPTSRSFILIAVIAASVREALGRMTSTSGVITSLSITAVRPFDCFIWFAFQEWNGRCPTPNISKELWKGLRRFACPKCAVDNPWKSVGVYPLARERIEPRTLQRDTLPPGGLNTTGLAHLSLRKESPARLMCYAMAPRKKERRSEKQHRQDRREDNKSGTLPASLPYLGGSKLTIPPGDLDRFGIIKLSLHCKR